MPSFDVVSKVDLHELTNAVDQTQREIGNRFDFKGSAAKMEQSEHEITVSADAEFQIGQILDIFHNKLAKRGIDISCLDPGEIIETGQQVRQVVTVRHGIDKELAKRIIKRIKEAKLKVQTAIQGEQVRVTGKKRDHLQEVINDLREADFGLPLQFINFRD